MAFRVELSRRTEQDLDDIYFDIGAAALPRAAVWFNELELTVQRLALFPARGAAALEGNGLRQMPYGRKPHIYQIYRLDERARLVSVTGIRHGARDVWALGTDPEAS